MPESPRDRLLRWRADPVAFVRENFAVEPDAWQVEFLRQFPNTKRQAAIACKGPGKSAVLSWLMWNFISTRLQPKIVNISCSGANLADCLWTEHAKWQAKSPFLKAMFEWSKSRISCRDFPETWWCSARQFAQSADPAAQADTLAGLHEDNVMIEIDEAGSVPIGLIAAAEAILGTPGGDKHIVMAGNPTSLEGPLYRASTIERELWKPIHITADPDDPQRTPRVTKEHAAEQIKKWGGKDNPYVLVNIFGQFPPTSINALLGPDDCTRSAKRQCPPAAYTHAAKVLGIDVARFGDDRTVIFPRQGLFASVPLILRAARTEVIVANVAKIAMDWNPDMIFIDGSGGYGAGVEDGLREAGFACVPVYGSGQATDQRFYNKRAEIHWEMAEWVKDRGVLPLPIIDELTKELTAPTYTLKKDQIIVEPKDHIKARLGFSPDLADALANTFAFPVMPKRNHADPTANQHQHHAADEYNPMERYLAEQ